ncbi:HEAT repeat domain-containing protein [Streptomyces varsoviensis]|uniref:HEAT repeat domain-containing protein n=1 Tax=Streptomyces varsoviensis TaxID=67373 RepID=A0ABR5J4A1_9ACTN|nr:HEAT repeat domain-containing protein [Streptomyces varsoviensis]KOG88179.1 hypothetical protein ADK38_21250 [Streptomyces varsoviensis]
MTMPKEDMNTVRVLRGLENSESSVRLKAALAMGTTPDQRFVGTLIERCAIEPEFYVREALTWALTRHSADVVVPELIAELRSERTGTRMQTQPEREARAQAKARTQARSQALHTLSKIGDRRAWPAITRELLTDADDEVARSAWRAAIVLVPEGEEGELAEVLAAQFGRGERETQLSLSRALIALGKVIEPILRAAMTHPDPVVRQHAIATDRLSRDPDAGFEFAIEEAKRIVALGPENRGNQENQES